MNTLTINMLKENFESSIKEQSAINVEKLKRIFSHYFGNDELIEVTIYNYIKNKEKTQDDYNILNTYFNIVDYKLLVKTYYKEIIDDDEYNDEAENNAADNAGVSKSLKENFEVIEFSKEYITYEDEDYGDDLMVIKTSTNKIIICLFTSELGMLSMFMSINDLKMTPKENLIRQLENMIESIKEKVSDDCKEILIRPTSDKADVHFYNNNTPIEIEVVNDTFSHIDNYYEYASEISYDEKLNDHDMISIIDM